MKIEEMFSQTIVSNDPAAFDDKVNKFLTNTMSMFEANYGSDDGYEISISSQPIIFHQEGDSNKPLSGINFIIEIYKDDDFYD